VHAWRSFCQKQAQTNRALTLCLDGINGSEDGINGSVVPTNSLVAISRSLGLKTVAPTPDPQLEAIKSSVQKCADDLRSLTGQILGVRSEARKARAQAVLSRTRSASIGIELPLGKELQTLARSENDAFVSSFARINDQKGKVDFANTINQINTVAADVASYVSTASALNDTDVYNHAKGIPHDITTAKAAAEGLERDVTQTIDFLIDREGDVNSAYASWLPKLEHRVDFLTIDWSKENSTYDEANATVLNHEATERSLVQQRDAMDEFCWSLGQNVTDVFASAEIDARVSVALGRLGDLWDAEK
jgi:hypothetical protein